MERSAVFHPSSQRIAVADTARRPTRMPARAPRGALSIEPPLPNRRGAETRRRIVAAALELLDELDLAEQLALLPTSSIAARSGRSERSVRHHFSDAADYRHALRELRRTPLQSPSDDERPLPRVRLQPGAPVSDAELRTWSSRCSPLFADGVENTNWAQLAAAAGVDASVLRLHFETRTAVAGIAFARHLPRVTAALTRHLGRDADRPLADALCEIARSVRDDVHCAAALVQLRADGEGTSSVDVHRLVPFDRYVMDAGRDVDEPQARRMIDTCLVLACANRRAAPGTIATWAMAVR
jgi:AcrR family transcriptional regulator